MSENDARFTGDEDRSAGEASRIWSALDVLVAASQIIVDRPRGSAHPRYPEFIYPLDYGYLAGTTSPDGGGIDVWLGSLPERRVTAVICNVDLAKRDSEVKLLLGCMPEEAQTVLGVHNQDSQSAMYMLRPPSLRPPQPAIRTAQTGRT